MICLSQGLRRVGVNRLSDGLRGALEAEGTGMKSQETHEGVMDSGKCKLVGWKVVCVFMRVSRNVAGKINRGWIQKSLYDLLKKCRLTIPFMNRNSERPS